jgi:hypothetical protein
VRGDGLRKGDARPDCKAELRRSPLIGLLGVAGVTDNAGEGDFSSITGGGETGGETKEGGCVPGASSSSEGGSLNVGIGGTSSSSGGGSLNDGRGGVESFSIEGSATAGSNTSSSLPELFDSEIGEAWIGAGGASGTVVEIVAPGTCAAIFCAACWAANISRFGEPTEILLRLMRISTGAVRFRTGTRRSDSRFFLAIVGGRISS